MNEGKMEKIEQQLIRDHGIKDLGQELFKEAERKVFEIMTEAERRRIKYVEVEMGQYEH